MLLQQMNYNLSSSANLIWLGDRHYLSKHKLLMAAHNWGMRQNEGSWKAIFTTVDDMVARGDVKLRIQMKVHHRNRGLGLERR